MKKITNLVKKQGNVICTAVLLVMAWLGTYGISYLSILFTADYFSNGIVSLFVYAIVFMMLKMTCWDLLQISERKACCKRVIYAFLLAFLFAVSLILGYQLRMAGMTESGFRGKLLIAIRALCLSFCVFPFTNYLFGWLEKVHDALKVFEAKKLWNSKKVFFISWAVVFLCWVPVFLAYYPAVMAYDFHRQSIEAAKGFVWFNNYQPLAHTWLIWVALQIGYAVNSLEFGMACYSIFQMLVFSVACGYSCVTVYRLIRKKWTIVVMVLFYGIFPYNSILSVGVTKDVLFSALFLIFMCLFVERTFLSNPQKQKVIDVLWLLEGCVMMLFRNNAIYAVAVFAVIALVLAEKKQRLRVFAICLLLVVGGKGALEGVQILLGTEGRGSKVEMFSVPIQQFSRVGHYHCDELDEETYELVNTYIPEEYWSRYNPPLSDSVKNWISAKVYNETWDNNLSGMLSAWVKVGLKYPNEYIDAFLLLNSGYWFVDDVTWAEVFGSGLEERMGALSTYTSSTSDVIPEGIAHESKLPALEAVLEEIVSANCFYNWPVISNLFKPAIYCWTLLLTVVACIYIKDKKKIMVTLLPLVYLATMFLGPVVQVRYVLPIIVVVPLMMAVWAAHKLEDANI